jgi:hypothetical protein
MNGNWTWTNFFANHPELEMENIKSAMADIAQPCSDLLLKCKIRNLVDGVEVSSLSCII